jgi:hypothetical protein
MNRNRRPPKRVLLSLKLAGVRGSAPLYRPGAERRLVMLYRWPPACPRSLIWTIPRLRHFSRTFAYWTTGTGRRMGINPANPSAPAHCHGTPHAVAGCRLVYKPSWKFATSHSSAGTPLASPVRLNDTTPLGASLCDLVRLSSFRLLEASLGSAIAPAIATPAHHGIQSMAFFRLSVAGGGHHSGGPAPSCRLCLIACNSRKFTCGQALRPPVPEEVVSGDR